METLTISRPCRSGDENLLPSPLWDFIRALFPGYSVPDTGRQPLSLRDRLFEWAGMPETRDGMPSPGPGSPAGAAVLLHRAITGSRETGSGPWCGDFRNVSAGVRAVLDARTGPGHRFSASQLELFLDCPRRFLFERIMGLAEPEAPIEELSPLERGNLIHDVLEMFYRERLRDGLGRVTPDTVHTAADRIRDLARDIFREKAYSGPAAERQLLDLVGRPELDDPGIADRFARLEAGVSPELQPEMLEWTFGRTEAVPPLALTDRDGVPVLITGKIDRIDGCGRELMIWDYKSGKLPAPADIAGLVKIQVGLYLLAAARLLDRTPTAGGYYQVPGRAPLQQKTVLRRSGSRIDALLPDAGRSNSLDRVWAPDEFDAYFKTLEAWIGECVGIMRSGWFSIRKDISRCHQCPFAGTCRPGKEMDYVPV